MAKTAQAEVQASSAPEQLRKITGKGIVGDLLEKGKELKKATPLFRVYGIVRGITPGTTNLGEYIKFKGDFLAERLDNGQQFRSSVFIAPKPLDDMLESQYMAAYNKDTGEAGEVRFSAEIGYKPDTNAYGYMWTATPLVAMQQNDELLALRNESLMLLENKTGK
jgi:hypothetical protein